MKNIFLLLSGIIITCSIQAQNSQSQRTGAVYITVNGNKNLQVAIDGVVKTFISTASTSTVNKTAPIANLEAGMHTLTFPGTGANNNRTGENMTTEFNLRRNFDMHINVNADGSIELIEKRKAGGGSNASQFNTTLRNLKAQTTNQSRNAYLNSLFNTPNTYFTSIQVVQLLQQIRVEADRLPLAKLSFRTVTDPANFSPVYGLFNVQANRTELENYVNYYDANTAGSATTTNGTAMSDSYFNSLYQNIRYQSPVSTQVASINNAFNVSGNYFTSSQVVQLLQLITAETSRLQLAKASYRTVVDPVNFTAVSNLLYTQSSRDELSAYINNGATGTTTAGAAMSEADYTTLHRSISSQFMPFSKITMLTNTFNNTAYYFTSSQVRGLLLLISSETNRLQLAKKAYRNTVDRVNYTQLNDLFTTASYKDDLTAYVKAYRD
ncbi:DUF4476 domain-containing protein [Lacibacter sp. H375]|uniref:DUF4476 domain-containing protein n=1 Tax=Lacibacter sp. H375 TaxID=3133424 RepID=UPI0030BAD244